MGLLKQFARCVPGVRKLIAERDCLRAELNWLGHPPGHFYSPIPCDEDVEFRFAALQSSVPTEIAGVDLNLDEQEAWFRAVAKYYLDCCFSESKTAGSRYYYSNNMFRYSDAFFLYGMLRSLQPKRIVEVGSGFSSVVMLDTIDKYFPGNTLLTFIEPFSQRLESLLTDVDKQAVRILREPVQRICSAPWKELQAGDILFVDSSHVCKCGSDVHFIFSQVLPALNDGVIVHFHDISLPFEYPQAWLTERNWAWNEVYQLHAFLQYNDRFKIIAWVPLLNQIYSTEIAREMPLCQQDSGGSIWVQKVGGEVKE